MQIARNIVAHCAPTICIQSPFNSKTLMYSFVITCFTSTIKMPTSQTHVWKLIVNVGSQICGVHSGVTNDCFTTIGFTRKVIKKRSNLS